MLGLVLLLIYFLSPVEAAEFVGKDGAPLVMIAEGPFLRGSPTGQHLQRKQSEQSPYWQMLRCVPGSKGEAMVSIKDLQLDKLPKNSYG